MENDLPDDDPFFLQLVQERLVEMQPGGWGGHRAFLPGKNGLVTFRRAFPGCDVRRQRHLTELSENGKYVVAAIDLHHPQAIFAGLYNFGDNAAGKISYIAGAELFPGPYHCFEPPHSEVFDEKDFEGVATLLRNCK